MRTSYPLFLTTYTDLKLVNLVNFASILKLHIVFLTKKPNSDSNDLNYNCKLKNNKLKIINQH